VAASGTCGRRLAGGRPVGRAPPARRGTGRRPPRPTARARATPTLPASPSATPTHAGGGGPRRGTLRRMIEGANGPAVGTTSVAGGAAVVVVNAGRRVAGTGRLAVVGERGTDAPVTARAVVRVVVAGDAVAVVVRLGPGGTLVETSPTCATPRAGARTPVWRTGPGAAGAAATRIAPRQAVTATRAVIPRAVARRRQRRQGQGGGGPPPPPGAGPVSGAIPTGRARSSGGTLHATPAGNRAGTDAEPRRQPCRGGGQRRHRRRPPPAPDGGWSTATPPGTAPYRWKRRHSHYAAAMDAVASGLVQSRQHGGRPRPWCGQGAAR
jgi:hypothetical protein